MIKRFRILLLSLYFQHVMLHEVVSDNKVVKCDGDPPITVEPKYCCQIPPIFKDVDLQSCGLKDIGPLDSISCDQQKCLMRSQRLLYDNDEIDKAAIGKFLDDWGVNNSDWKKSIDMAKGKCLGDQIPITDHMCEANKQMYCISATLFENCAVWNDDVEDCTKLRRYVDMCIYYFAKIEPVQDT